MGQRKYRVRHFALGVDWQARHPLSGQEVPTQLRGVQALGHSIGVNVYCYSADANVAAGAYWTLQVLSGKTLELPVFLDMEDSKIDPLGRNTLTQITVSFCDRIQKGGFASGVYAL